MSAYRRHIGGISSANVETNISRLEKKIKLLDTIDEYLSYQYSDIIKMQQQNIKDGIAWNILRNFLKLRDTNTSYEYLTFSRVLSLSIKKLKQRLLY